MPVLARRRCKNRCRFNFAPLAMSKLTTTVSIKSQVTGVLQKAHLRRSGLKRTIALYRRSAPARSGAQNRRGGIGADSAQLRNMREQLQRYYSELVEKQYVSREQYDQSKPMRMPRKRWSMQTKPLSITLKYS